jgi:hypothetical protein
MRKTAIGMEDEHGDRRKSGPRRMGGSSLGPILGGLTGSIGIFAILMAAPLVAAGCPAGTVPFGVTCNHGQISINGGSGCHDQTRSFCIVPANGYTILSTPDTGFTFSSWTHAGSVTIANVNAASTTMNVTATGSITANVV